MEQDSPPPPPAAPKPAPDLSSALTTGRALVLLQLLSRLLTFALNQGLVRLAPPEVFGTAAIQFDLVASTILFLSREGVRNALLRSKRSDDSDSAAEVLSTSDAALAALPLRLGVGVAAVVLALYLGTAPVSTTSQPYFHAALALYVASALMELAIEPLYVRALRETPPRIRVRVQAEGGMAIVKAVVSFLFLVADKSGRGALLGFAAGQAAGAAWLAGRYVYEYGGVQSIPSLLAPAGSGGRDGQETQALAMANTRQSVVKHVLTEADRLAVGYISPLGDQGGYAVAMNYGSLVARIIFQPVEETLLLHWSRALASTSTLPLLTLALRLSLHLALLLPVFLPPLLPVVLPVLLPRRYARKTNAAETLQTYIVCYLPILSLNGILETFHTASAAPAQVARQARFMIASSAAFALSLLAFTRGPDLFALATNKSLINRSTTGKSFLSCTTEQALIYASCIAMSVRIAYALQHARAVFAARGTPLRLSSIVPKAPVCYAVATAGAAVWYLASSRPAATASLRDQALLLAVGGAGGLAVLYTMYTVERGEFAAVRREKAV